MEKRRKAKRGWELATKIVIIPTVAEIMRKENLSREEAAKRCIAICGQKHKKKNVDCFRKLNGHKLCDGCPKYQEEKKPKVGEREDFWSTRRW